MSKKIVIDLPTTEAQANDLIYNLEHYYETTGLTILKTAADELKRLYDLFQLSPAEMEQYTPEVIIRMGLVMKVGCKYFNISQGELVSHVRSLKCMIPRQIIMYLAKELTNLSYPQIGDWFDRDHTTIVYAHQKLSEQIKSQPQIAKYVKDITTLCQREALEEHKRTEEFKKCHLPQVAPRRKPTTSLKLPKPTPQPIRLSMDV